ncbi:MAG: response regulator [Nitrospirae bacterium]|nr:response regulator [Nitrospirota bacterium]
MSYPRILVIDDEENFLGLLSKVLGKEGYEVRTTTDGNQALRWHEEEPFDLVFVDIRMRPIDGFSILDRVKNLEPGTKVVMLSTYPGDQTRAMAFLKGAVEYLVKPIDIDVLKETVREHLLPP